ncbi:class I SAM-dependent methyltransferase [Campylobacter fetus]|nr:caffeoyl-CoA O-methyltransferase [Campylobacter fetus]TXF07632.1 caffeoyl-CoA O-methyltransferase [Campylobacter fetus subsp. fetus]EAI3887019.1 caffeoyl-CoA O-methyltransferase [Campylobacter fetus]EAI3916220.1 caffeoyl-CoA O-methyltransferase [Campylobacter fetus]EAI3919616.1 caffeoyl-CoA O-methyltransferase [Campylobacter fetus]
MLELYNEDKKIVDKKIYDIACKYSNTENKDFEFEFPTEFPGQQYMGSDCLERKLQEFILKMINANNALEIGTFVGASTINIAKFVSGQVDTIEKYDKFYNIAKRNIEKSEVKNINLINGDAIEILNSNKIGNNYDFIFLDGNKENYKEYFKIVKQKLNRGGVLMLDDAYFMGDILNIKPVTPKGIGVKKFLDYIKNDKDFITMLLPLQYGIFLAMRVN